MARPKRSPLDYIRGQIWVHEVAREAGISSLSQIDEALGFTKDRSWYKYRRGENAPDKKTVAEVETVLPGTDSWFYEGPKQIFSVLECTRIQDAISFLKKAGVPTPEDDDHLDGNFYINYLSRAGLSQLNFHAEYGRQRGNDDSIFAWILGAAHSEARFLGNTYSLELVVHDCLEYFHRRYSIAPERWEHDVDIKEARAAVTAFGITKPYVLK